MAFYILSTLFMNNIIIIFVITMLLATLDFWVVKNVSKRILLTQKCGDVINTQQARRSEWNETRDLLGFNTEPVDFENPTTC